MRKPDGYVETAEGKQIIEHVRNPITRGMTQRIHVILPESIEENEIDTDTCYTPVNILPHETFCKLVEFLEFLEHWSWEKLQGAKELLEELE